jgi:hypothetical protein
LWNEATVYCKAHTSKPNCAPILQIYILNKGSTEVPAYGTSGHALVAPDFR